VVRGRKAGTLRARAPPCHSRGSPGTAGHPRGSLALPGQPRRSKFCGRLGFRMHNRNKHANARAREHARARAPARRAARAARHPRSPQARPPVRARDPTWRALSDLSTNKQSKPSKGKSERANDQPTNTKGVRNSKSETISKQVNNTRDTHTAQRACGIPRGAQAEPVEVAPRRAPPKFDWRTAVLLPDHNLCAQHIQPVCVTHSDSVRDPSDQTGRANARVQPPRQTSRVTNPPSARRSWEVV
jgi:hypothetical protein